MLTSHSGIPSIAFPRTRRRNLMYDFLISSRSYLRKAFLNTLLANAFETRFKFRTMEEAPFGIMILPLYRLASGLPLYLNGITLTSWFFSDSLLTYSLMHIIPPDFKGPRPIVGTT